MPVTPAGTLSEPFAQLRTVISQSAAFQARVGAANAAEALPYIHVYLGSDDRFTSVPKPAVVLTYREAGYTQIASGPTFMGGGTIWMVFLDDAKEDTEEDSFLDFCNFVGGVIDNLAETGGVDSFINHGELPMVEAPNRTAPNERQEDSNDYWRCIYAFNWTDAD